MGVQALFRAVHVHLLPPRGERTAVNNDIIISSSAEILVDCVLVDSLSIFLFCYIIIFFFL